MRFFHICLLIVSLTVVSCRFKIVSPSSLKSQVGSPVFGVPYQLARYGKIPYGSNLVGTLKLANPENACQNLAQDEIQLDKNVQVPIIVVRRGGCRYAVKTRYAQLAGAKMVVIIADTNDLPNSPIGIDQESITIPTILIGKEDGQKIYEALKAGESAELGSQEAYIFASMSFPYGQLSEKVSLDFWFSTADATETVYRFLNDFKPLYLQSKDVFDFHPHYVTWYCSHCKPNDDSNPDCLSGGRYCAPDPDASGPLNGAVVVRESIRQICLWNEFGDLWWDYIQGFAKCVNREIQELCVKQLLQEIGINNEGFETLEECTRESFIKTPEEQSQTVNEKLDDNKLLNNERLLQDEYDISMFPSLFINHQLYQGNFNDAATVFKGACESLINPSELCKTYVLAEPAKLQTKTIIIFLVVMLVLVILILYFYRRMQRREMTKEMSLQVSQMVSQYFALTDVKKGRNDKL